MKYNDGRLNSDSILFTQFLNLRWCLKTKITTLRQLIILWDMFAELWRWILGELGRDSHFLGPSTRHDDDPITGHYGFYPVSYREDGPIPKTSPEHFLDKMIGFQIYVCSGFIDADNLEKKDETSVSLILQFYFTVFYFCQSAYLCWWQYSSGETNQLPLAHRKRSSPLFDMCIQTSQRSDHRL